MFLLWVVENMTIDALIHCFTPVSKVSDVTIFVDKCSGTDAALFRISLALTSSNIPTVLACGFTAMRIATQAFVAVKTKPFKSIVASKIPYIIVMSIRICVVYRFFKNNSLVRAIESLVDWFECRNAHNGFLDNNHLIFRMLVLPHSKYQ